MQSLYPIANPAVVSTQANRLTRDWITSKTLSHSQRVVSNPANQANTKTTPKLLDYLIKHKHWSPFEMASACIEIETTRDIARQLLRHRSFSFQEFSQRYADIRDLDDNFVIRDARLQDPKNRQNSIETDDQRSSTGAMVRAHAG